MFIVLRSLTLLVLLVLVAGCRESTKPKAAPTTPASDSPRALQPSPPAPRITGVSAGPPPAWLETERGNLWLGYSSYCWGTACVDFVAPRCQNSKQTPRIRLRRGERVTAHLRFRPTELGLAQLGSHGARRTVRQKRLRLSSHPSWVVSRSGVFSLFARAKGGDASYVACVVFR